MKTSLTGKWITIPEAAAILQIPAHAMRRLLIHGKLTIRKFPGTRSQLLREDVERMARESVIPATNGPNATNKPRRA